MRHRSARPNRAYAAIPNAVLRDESVSIEARGVLALLMSYADNWEFRAVHVMRVAGIGRDKLARIMRELTLAGYVEKQVRRAENGRLDGSGWIIRDEPNRATGNPSLGGTEALKTRQSAKPTSGEPAPKRRTKEKENQNVCAADAAQHTHSSFEEFWKAHPKVRDRDGTSKAFNKAVANGADPVQIIAGAKAYTEEQAGNGKQYLASSVNWLKARRWADHLTATAKPIPDAAMINQRLADNIRDGKPWVVSTVSAHRARELIAMNMVTVAECKAAGVAV